jgi:hypothetical protein
MLSGERTGTELMKQGGKGKMPAYGSKWRKIGEIFLNDHSRKKSNILLKPPIRTSDSKDAHILFRHCSVSESVWASKFRIRHHRAKKLKKP